MSLPQLAVRIFAARGDYISHLGPRPVQRADEGPLTLCGLYLAGMERVTAAGDLRPCALCADLSEADLWVHLATTIVPPPRT